MGQCACGNQINPILGAYPDKCAECRLLGALGITIQTCDFCSGKSINLKVPNPNAELAVVDGPTKSGPWAFMCGRHLHSAGYPDSKLNKWLNQKTEGDRG